MPSFVLPDCQGRGLSVRTSQGSPRCLEDSPHSWLQGHSDKRTVPTLIIPRWEAVIIPREAPGKLGLSLAGKTTRSLTQRREPFLCSRPNTSDPFAVGGRIFCHLPKTVPNIRDLTALNSVPDDRITCLLAFWLTYETFHEKQTSKWQAILMVKREGITGTPRKTVKMSHMFELSAKRRKLLHNNFYNNSDFTPPHFLFFALFFFVV